MVISILTGIKAITQNIIVIVANVQAFTTMVSEISLDLKLLFTKAFC